MSTMCTTCRAAFEHVSRLLVNRLDSRHSVINFRECQLPDETLPREEDAFRPREHREPKEPISTSMAYFNLLRVLCGAGVLGLPLAISQAGIVLGPLLSLFTGIMLVHTHIMLAAVFYKEVLTQTSCFAAPYFSYATALLEMILWCLDEISRQLRIPYISYRYGFRLALLHGPPVCQRIAEYGPFVIALSMVLSQIGICSVFFIFTSDSLRDILDWDDSRSAMLCLLIPYILLLLSMKSLKIVSSISLAGNFMNLVGLILIFYHIFADPHGELIVATTSPIPFLFAFGTLLFNTSVVGVVLSLDKALVNPVVMVKRFGVISIGIMVPTVVSTVFGALGYWSFGTMEENILRSLPYDDFSTMAAIGLYLVAVAFSYPIQSYPAIQIVMEVIKNHDIQNEPSAQSLKIMEFITRPIFVFITFLVSYFVPFQGPFVAFVGNMCTTLLAMVYPATMELCLLYPNKYGKYKFYMIKDLFLIVIGVISWVFGVGFCGYLIYVRILSMNSPNDGDFL